jgi:hypothetical protein
MYSMLYINIVSKYKLDILTRFGLSIAPRSDHIIIQLRCLTTVFVPLQSLESKNSKDTISCTADMFVIVFTSCVSTFIN